VGPPVQHCQVRLEQNTASQGENAPVDLVEMLVTNTVVAEAQGRFGNGSECWAPAVRQTLLFTYPSKRSEHVISHDKGTNSHCKTNAYTSTFAVCETTAQLCRVNCLINVEAQTLKTDGHGTRRGC